jgi:hypothetical protein
VAHPEQYGFSGGNIWHVVRESVNILNRLFMSEKSWLVLTERKRHVCEETGPFFSGCRILVFESKRYLIEKTQITIAALVNNEWRYLLVAHPVYNDLARAFKQQAYLSLFCLEITDLLIQGETVFARLVSNNDLIRIEPDEQAANQQTYQKFLSDWKEGSDRDRYLLETATSHEPILEQSAIYYRYLVDYNESSL